MLVSLGRTALKVVGSLLLTVAILAVLIAILLWGTVVEADYGATAAKFGIYGSWWFNALGLLLGLNSTALLISSWPWKLKKLGFILPHLGLVVLLVGCFISRRYGSEWTVSVYEGTGSSVAYKGASQKVELDGQQQFTLKVLAADGQEKSGGPIVVPFTSGPFNWEDFHNGTLGTLPWSLAHYDFGVLYDRDGIRLEVLDYLSNSEIASEGHAGMPSLDDAPSARPLPFDKSEDHMHLRQAYVRLTVDGQSGEFWMPCSAPDGMPIPKKLATRSVAGNGRNVELTFAAEQFHLGYTIFLRKAYRRLDPGSRQASFYASDIDLVPNEYAGGSASPDSSPGHVPGFENLRITLNAPLDFADPGNPGRSYRMFQANMSPLQNPEDVGLKTGEQVYQSGLTLNNDPGRGLTYVGCLLVVAGIFVAYFVRFAKI